MNTSIAFLVLAHHEFDYLEQSSHYYCADGDGLFVHIDARVEAPFFKKCHENTVILSKNERFKTYWGSYNIVRATQALLQKALSAGDFQHFILASGVDLPLLSKPALKQQIAQQKSYLSIWQQVDKNKQHALNHEFFQRHYYHANATNPGQAYATKRRCFIYPMLLLNKLIAAIPLNQQRFIRQYYYKGSQWWCVSRQLAQYFVEQLSKPDIINEFKWMHAPDEKVFQTLAMSSPYQHELMIDYGQASLKQGIHFIDWGFKQKKVALQPFSFEQISAAKEQGCAFSRKLVTTNSVSVSDHFKQLIQGSV